MSSIIDPLNCTNAPESTPSDGGIAGQGILLSFMITAGLAIILSASVIFGEFRGKESTTRRKLLNGYSDSQIMQGIGIRSVGLAKMNSLVPYHFFLIWMLSLLSMATHNATLLALVHDYRRDWVLRWMRQFLMFVNLALSSVSGIFVLQAVSKGLEKQTLPIACVWEKFYKAVQVVGLVLMTAVAIGAGARIILLSQAFGHPSVKLSDEGEKGWSFGQLLSMLLLVMPLVSAVEIYRGEIKVAPPVQDDRQRLYDGELQSDPQIHRPFQPNPFFGSETDLFKRKGGPENNEP